MVVSDAGEALVQPLRWVVTEAVLNHLRSRPAAAADAGCAQSEAPWQEQLAACSSAAARVEVLL